MTETNQNKTPNFKNPETIITPDRRVACDGGGGALGHPRVFLTMTDDGVTECPYCDRRFILKGGPSHHNT